MSSTVTAERAVGLFDVHLDPENDEFHPAYKVARQYTLDVEPEILVLGGDFGTYNSLSSWNKKKPLKAEGKRYYDDYTACLDELYMYTHRLPNTRKVFIMGNHEQRAEWLVEKHPNMKDFVNLRRQLELDDLGWEVVDFEDYIQIGELAWTHGWYWNEYHAAMTLKRFVGNVVYGHVHHHQVDTQNVHFGKKQHIALSSGCLSDRYPEWKGKKPTRFQNGFVTVNYRKDGKFNIDHHMIFGGEFSYNGFTWRA